MVGLCKITWMSFWLEHTWKQKKGTNNAHSALCLKYRQLENSHVMIFTNPVNDIICHLPQHVQNIILAHGCKTPLCENI